MAKSIFEKSFQTFLLVELSFFMKIEKKSFLFKVQKYDFFRENILKRNLLSEVLDNHISQKIWRWQQMSFMASILQISKSRAVISTLGEIRYENVKPLSEIRTFTLKQYILMNSFEISKNLAFFF